MSLKGKMILFFLAFSKNFSCQVIRLKQIMSLCGRKGFEWDQSYMVIVLTDGLVADGFRDEKRIEKTLKKI